MRKDQHTVQRIVVTGSYLNDLKDWKKEERKCYRWDDVEPLVDQVIKLTEKILAKLVSYGDKEQMKFIKKMNDSCRVILTGEFDPRTKMSVGFVDWDTMCIIAGYACEGSCKMCMKNKDEVRKCGLRIALKELGAEYGKNQIGTCSCEFSKV